MHSLSNAYNTTYLNWISPRKIREMRLDQLSSKCLRALRTSTWHPSWTTWAWSSRALWTSSTETTVWCRMSVLVRLSAKTSTLCTTSYSAVWRSVRPCTVVLTRKATAMSLLWRPFTQGGAVYMNLIVRQRHARRNDRRRGLRRHRSWTDASNTGDHTLFSSILTVSSCKYESVTAWQCVTRFCGEGQSNRVDDGRNVRGMV